MPLQYWAALPGMASCSVLGDQGHFMVEDVVKRLERYKPKRLQSVLSLPQAAVLVPLTRADNPELILTRRAHDLSTHAGEVAFPGGRRDPGDCDLLHTALRESQEEVGLDPHCVQIAGSLSQLVSRHGIEVTPYVGIVPEGLAYCANAGEIDSIFSVPLEFFAEDVRETTHRIDYLGKSWYVPSYRFREYKIWGLTAVMVVELVNLLYDRKLRLDLPPLLSKKEI